MDRAWVYRDLAIAPNEAAALLGLEWPAYQSYVRSGRFSLSLDLCELRPSVFKAHTFWDIIEFCLAELLVSMGQIETSIAQTLTTALLDEIAYTLEVSNEDVRERHWADFEKGLRGILASSISKNRHTLVKEIVNKWSDLEYGFVDILRSNRATTLSTLELDSAEPGAYR